MGYVSVPWRVSWVAIVWLGHGWGFSALGAPHLPNGRPLKHLAALLPVSKVVEAENDVWGKLSQLAFFFFFFSSIFFSKWWFQFFLFFPLFGGRFPIWLISFFRWVGSTTKYSCCLKDPFFCGWTVHEVPSFFGRLNLVYRGGPLWFTL